MKISLTTIFTQILISSLLWKASFSNTFEGEQLHARQRFHRAVVEGTNIIVHRSKGLNNTFENLVNNVLDSTNIPIRTSTVSSIVPVRQQDDVFGTFSIFGQDLLNSARLKQSQEHVNSNGDRRLSCSIKVCELPKSLHFSEAIVVIRSLDWIKQE